MGRHATLNETRFLGRLSTRRFLSDFVLRADVGVAILDRDLRYLAINPWLAAKHGIPPELHLRKHLTEVLGEVASQVEPALTQILATGRPVFNVGVEGTFPSQQQRKRWLCNYFPMKDSQGRVNQLAAIVAELGADEQLRDFNDQQLGNTSHDSGLLRSWKEISGYLGACPKTAQRWELKHNLPVRRVTTGKGAVVFALRSELDQWIRMQALRQELRPRAWLDALQDDASSD
jgi:transcriptional regulator with PAS, ATPase and Fis domain